MKRIFNRLLTIMLVAVSVLTLVACDGLSNGDIIESKGLLIKKDYNGDYVISKYTEDTLTGGVLDIGAILDEKQISGNIRVKAGAFDGNNNVKTLIISSKVTEIDAGAFRNMKALEKLEVPFIGKTANADAFFNQTASATDKSVDSERTLAHYFGSDSYDEGRAITVAGKTVYMPVNFNTITVNATKGHDVVLEDGTTDNFYSIPYDAFNGATNLTSITLKGDKLVEIGENAFNGCTGLKQITIPATVKTIYKNAFNGCTKLNTVTIEANDLVIKEGAFSGCSAMDKFNSSVAKTIDLTNIKSIGEDALDFGRKVDFNVNQANIEDSELTLALGDTKKI